MIDSSYPRIWQGTEWEQYIQRLLKNHHGHGNYLEMPAKHGGDFGLEGFSIEEGYAYQCYAAMEPISTKERYEKQRDKINDDINKFIANESKLKQVFGATSIQRWFLVVPIYDSSQLALYISKKTQNVLDKKLSYVSESFRIMVITDQYFETEINNLKTAGIFDISPIDITSKDTSYLDIPTEEQNSNLVHNLDKKINKLENLVTQEERNKFQKDMLDKYLKGQNQLNLFFEKLPEIHAKLKNCKNAYEYALEARSSLNNKPSSEYLVQTFTEYSDKLSKTIPNLDILSIQILSWEAITDWLTRCPLDFKNKSHE